MSARTGALLIKWSLYAGVAVIAGGLPGLCIALYTGFEIYLWVQS